jgi:SAM-dependent methyltransferase
MAERVCPVWIGYLLASPVRKLFQDPEKILRPLVKENMRVMDIGSAMGFFSLPLAGLVGRKGRVFPVDMQEKMLRKLRERAARAGLIGRIETRICRQDSLMVADLKGTIDFVLAFAMVHEVPDKERLFGEIFEAMNSEGRLLVAEPSGHVTTEDFDETVRIAESKGFQSLPAPSISRSISRIFIKRPI